MKYKGYNDVNNSIMMLKAGSLPYAILICIVVGVFCFAILMMSSYGKMHQNMLFTYTELITNNTSAQHYFLGNIQNIENKEETVDLFDNGIKTVGVAKPWGFYKVLQTQSVFRKDTINQTVLIGQQQKNQNLALYLTDNGKALFMVEKAKVIGNAALPKGGIRPGYITNQSYRNTNYLSGSKSISNRQLPTISNTIFEYEKNNITQVDAADIDPKLSYDQSFLKKTLLVNVNGIRLRQKKLSGNIIVQSKDSIYIQNDNVLDGIIIKAPKVVFEEGFVGNVQVVAEELVTLEEKVILKYPSGILIQDTKPGKKDITIGKESKVLGAVIMHDVDKRRNLSKMITIQEEAEVIGDVYCTGKTQLKGTVIGTVYTNNFYLRTLSSIYDNYIMNGVINRKSLPDNFIRVPILKTNTIQENTYAIIKKL